MNLLSSLASGFLGAANGTAEIYVRGTSTRATVYDDFEASASDSSGADIVLDAYGSATVYVNQLVDVVVKDPDGAEVKNYTDGYASPNVEAITQSFMGVNYVTGVSAANNPTTLQQILDLWKTNSGAVDWKVLLGGVAQTLQVALGSLNGLVFNVKNPAYGAVGDGVANDQSAIAAALAAAVAAGGGIVFFPIGTYLTTSAIVWDYRVHIVMVPGASISINHATNGIIRFTSANSTNNPTIFYGVGFAASQSNTGVSVSLEAAQRLVLDSCIFGSTANLAGHHINVAASVLSLTVRNTRFILNGSARSAISCSSGYVGVLSLVRNYFITPATYTTSVVATDAFSTSFTLWVESNYFDALTNSTSAGGIAIRIGANCADAVVSSNRIVGIFTYGIFVDGNGPWRLFGNEWGSTVVNRYSISGTGVAGSYVELDKYESVTTALTPTFSANTEYTEYVSNSTAPTVTMSNGFYAGQPKRTLFRNTSGGNWAAVAFAGASVLRVTSLPATAVTAGSSLMDVWIWTDHITPGTFVWLKYAEA